MEESTLATRSLPTDAVSWRLPPHVARSIAELRGGIRTYVWLEGIAWLICLAGIAFWLALSIDWLFEPTPRARLLGWGLVAAAAGYLIYWLVISRLRRHLSDADLALVLERRFPELDDSLLTIVELRSRGTQSAVEDRLLELAGHVADERVANLPLERVFNPRPLRRSAALGIVLVLSVVLFAFTYSDAFGVWIRRLALSTELWPRQVHLVVDGFEPQENGQRVALAARDSQFELIVRADLTQQYQLPRRVEIRYRLADGRRGRAAMSRRGQAVAGRHAFQEYRYQFKALTADLVFDVVGGDARIDDLRLRVVERPRIVNMELDCEFPAYLSRADRTLNVTGNVELPEATRVTLRARTNKRLRSVLVSDVAAGQGTSEFAPPSDGYEFQLALPPLANDAELAVSLEDDDGIVSQEPYRLSIVHLPDAPPQVNARLAGVRTAITPDARIPFSGRISDDYGLDRIWFEYRVDQQPLERRQWARLTNEVTAVDELELFDLRAYDSETKRRLVDVQVGQRFSLTIAAADRYDLSAEPRWGTSPAFQFEIVTPAQLRALLERRELSLRQRFESIQERMLDTRDLLARTLASAKVGRADRASADASAGRPPDDPDEQPAAGWQPATLRIVGAKQNVTQAASETLGVATAFDEIRAELINNRIATEELKRRLADLIAAPLRDLANRRMPELQNRLQWIEEQAGSASIVDPLREAVALADAILTEMSQILQQMLELENYNEVLGMLRKIIEDQHDLQQRTRIEQLNRLRGLLDDQ